MLSPPGIVRGASGFCPQARVLKGHCTSDRCPTRMCAKNRTTRATSGIGGLGVASAMSDDDVSQWSPVPIGLAAFSTLRSGWVSGPRSGQSVPDALPARNHSFPGALQAHRA